MTKQNNPSEKIKSLIGAEVSTIELGYDVHLNFYGGQNREKKYAELRINVPFQLEKAKKALRLILAMQKHDPLAKPGAYQSVRYILCQR